MRVSRVAVIGALALASVVGACSAVSHVGALHPPSLSAIKLQDQLPQFRQVPAPRTQLGVGIDFYTYPGENVMAAAKSTIAYLKSLHANSISISFPYFMHGKHASRVYADGETPSPAELAGVAALAEKAGLYMSLRPLLDETSLGVPRTNWRPDNLAAWFASYQRFLLPYAEMAQETRIPEFIEGAEFSVFGHSRQWNGLANALRRIYTGTLAYDNNWGIPVKGNGGKGVVEGVDSYQPMTVPRNASVSQLTAAWTAYDRTLAPGTVELEVDIAAVPGAYLKPYQVSGWNEKSLSPSIQVRWFTAACNGVAKAHLGGIYFWGVGLGQSTRTPPDLANPASWVNSPGEVAISDCFGKLGGT
jgi:hypothetical protein